MSASVGSVAFPILSAGLLIFTLPGCESSGSYRVASVGAQGPQGIQGPQGAEGPAGQDGGAGAGGLDGAAALATGGLVGPGGVGGTGLLANTGDPHKPAPAGSGVLVATGDALSAGAARGAPLAERVDGATPGGNTITGRVIGTANAAGQAMVRAGNGQDYLVDGIAASPGQLVTFDADSHRVVGSAGAQPLIGASAASPSAQRGDLVTVGAGNQDAPVTVGTPATGTQSPAPATGVIPAVTAPLGIQPPRGN